MVKKINIVLDIDQTLISSEEYKHFSSSKHKDKMKKFYNKNFEDLYIVFERPNLQEFLDFLFKNFNVSIWTAASKSYALFIIDNFVLTKPERKLDFIFFSYHCDMSLRLKKGLKGLCMLWDTFGLNNYSSTNTFIIDDNPDVKKIQESNCLEIKPFYFFDDDSEHDNELEKIQHRLK